MNPNQIKELLSKSERGIINQVGVWLEFFQRDVTELERLFRTYPSDSAKIGLEDLERLLGLNSRLIKNSFRFSESIREDKILGVWQTYYEEMLAKIPQFAEYSLPYDFYKRSESDRYKIIIWKSNQRMLWKIRKGVCKLRNRSWSEEQIMAKVNKVRSFDQHDLLHFYLYLPVKNMLIETIPEIFRNYAYLIHLNHEIMNLTVRCFRLKDDEENADKLIALNDVLAEKKKEFLEKLELFKTTEQRVRDTVEQVSPGINEILEIAFMNAGTFLLPTKLYIGRIKHLRIKNQERIISNTLLKWEQIFTGERGEWLKDLDMSQTVAVLRKSKNRILDNINNRFENNALKKYSALREAIERFSYEVDQFKDLSITDKELTRKTELFRKRFREELITEALQQLIHNDLLVTVQSFWEDLNKSIEALPEDYSILLQLDLTQEIPNSVTASFALKKIIKEEILQDLSKDVESIKTRISSKQNKTIRNISEFDNILVFNSELAIEHLQKHENHEEHQKAINMIVEAINRVIALLNESEKNDRQLVEEVTENIKKLALVSGTSLTSFLDPATVSSIRSRITKAMAREQYRKVLFSGLSFVKKYIKIVWDFIFNILSLLMGRYHKIKEMAGIETASEDVHEHIAHLLRESELLFEKLPYIFQKLYENNPVTDNRLFVMRKKEIEAINNQYNNFKNSHPAKVMVYGETGSGKTSLLNFMRNMVFKKEKVVSVTIDRTILSEVELTEVLTKAFELENISNLSELANQLLKLEQKIVLICENFNNLYLRTVDGFKLLNDFILLMNRTQKNVFWIVTGNKYSWDYLQVVSNVKPHFTKVIDLGNLNVEEIKNVITKRQRISGYQVIYTPSEDDVNSKAYKKCKSSKEKQNYLEQKFFTRLAAASGGNLMVAMQLSLQAIQKVEKDYLIVSSGVKVDSAFLNALSEESLFVLTALLQHGVLTIKQTATIFNMKIETATLIINSLCDKSIIVDEDGHFKIHPYLFRPVVQILTTKNLLM